MRDDDNTPFFHWTTLALLALLGLLAASEAWAAQGSGASAVFEGRPALSGAQAGTGAMAGPPQGGLGVPGSEGSRPGLLGPVPTQPMAAPAAAQPPSVAALDGDKLRKSDPGVAKEQRSTTRKAKRAVRRSVERARTGSAPVDASGG